MEQNLIDETKMNNKKENIFVLLRGLTRDSFHWSGFDEVLSSEFGDSSRIFCIDLPGFGEKRDEISPASVEEIASKSLHNISGLRGYKNVVIIGLSLGGMVALADVASNPEKWTHCLILSSSQKRETFFWQRLNLLTLPSFLSGAFFSKKLFEKTAYSSTINFPKNKEAEVNQWIAHRNKAPFKRKNAFRQLFAGAKFKLSGDFKEIKTKGLVLASRKDKLVSYKNSEVISKLTHWPLKLHDSAGHDLTYDDPAWVIKNLKELIKE